MEANSEVKSAKRRESGIHLWVSMYLEQPVFGEAQLNSLHQVIKESLPTWSAGLQVVQREHANSSRSVGSSDSLFRAIHAEAPPRRGLGSAVLRGSYDGVSFFLNTFDPTLPPQLNYISVEVIDITALEGQFPSEWAYQFFMSAAATLPLRYGRACADAEFRAKNMISDVRGMRAVGVYLEESLPGIYWLNYFGPPYTKLIGIERLLSSPALEARTIGNGAVLLLDGTAAKWTDPAYKTREQAVIDHIGAQYFFLHNDLDRRTVAPDFREEYKTRSVS